MVCLSIAWITTSKKATEAWIEADIAGYGSPETRSNLDLSAPSVNLKTELAPCSTLAVIGLIRKGTELISFQNRRIKTTVKRKQEGGKRGTGDQVRRSQAQKYCVQE